MVKAVSRFLQRPLRLALPILVVASSLLAGPTPGPVQAAASPDGPTTTPATVSPAPSGLLVPHATAPTPNQIRAYAQHHILPNFNYGQPQAALSPALAASSLAAMPASTGFGPWQFLGPQPQTDERCCGPTPGSNDGNVSGRVTSLAVSPADPTGNTVYVGTAGGGVWKSTNGGTTWVPLTDNQASLAIGALAIDPTGQIIYAGTGEDNQSDSQYGQGLLVSTNGGTTWTLAGQSTFAGRHIGSIAIDRSNSNHVLVATDGGLFVSTNGAAGPWTQNTQILSPSVTTYAGPQPSGGIFQVIQDPSNALKFWASVGDFCNTEYGDILTSTDGGNTWAQSLDVYNNYYVTNSKAAGRIALGVGPSNTVYAALADCSGNLLDIQKTTTGGASWAEPSGVTAMIGAPQTYFNLSNPQGTYDTVVAVDPNNANNAAFGGVTILTTTNGGSSFTDVGDVYGEVSGTTGGFIHPDFHAVAFYAANSFYVGNDGGMWKTADMGGTGAQSDWTDLNATLATTQYYAGSAQDLSHLLGGAQDNGSSGFLPGAAAEPSWQSYHGGDGGYTAIDPTDSGTIYATYPDLGIEKGSWTLTASDPSSPYDSFTAASPCSASSVGCSDPVGFVAPYVMGPTNAKHLLAGTNHVYQTTDGGTSWASISPDLTTGTTYFQNGDFLSAMVMGQTASQTGIIFTGSAGGDVYETTNGGTNWINITGNLPTLSTTGATYVFPNPWISGIAFNPANPQEAWVTIGGLGVSHVWHTVNAGAAGGTTWAALDGSGATAVPNEVVSSVVLDPTHPGTIYLGTYDGALVCTTCGGSSAAGSWSILGTGLPNVYVNFLTVTADGQDLIAWTHGRGAWALPLATSSPTPTPTGGIHKIYLPVAYH